MRSTVSPSTAVRLLAVLLLNSAFATAGLADVKFQAAAERGVSGSYVVTLARDAVGADPSRASVPSSVAEAAERLAEAYGGTIQRVWERAIQGFEIHISEARAMELATDPWVERVEQSRVLVKVGELPANCYGHGEPLLAGATPEAALAWRTLAAQPIVCDDPDPRNPNRDCPHNWGLDRIDQTGSVRDGVYGYDSTAPNVHVYLIDTGVNASHVEFQEFGPPFTRVVGGTNVIPGNSSPPTQDCVGHGTHVAGIVGGTESGVAKKAWIHPVKFYDKCASPFGGTLPDAISGIEWVLQNHSVATNGPAVVNFSGGNVPWTATQANVVSNLVAAGISFVQSAGNQEEDACGRTVAGISGMEDKVLIAGGTDTNFISGQWQDGRWRREGYLTTGGTPDPSYQPLCPTSIHDCGSNVGSCVDVFAPAAHIVSAKADDVTGFCRLSGTSMAAPHVTGAVALYLREHPAATPQEVHGAIVGGATCGVLDDDPLSDYFIGDGSPNLLLHSLLQGGGPAACDTPLAIYDGFSGNGALDGTITETGATTWTARQGARTGAGRVIDSAAIGGVPLDPSFFSGGASVAVSARIAPTLTEWVGAGFAASPYQAYWGAGQFWVLLRPSGTYAIHANGTASNLGSGSIPGSPVGGYHEVEVRYDSAANSGSVLINGVQVLTGQPLGFTPALDFAGFHMHGAAEGGGKVDDFEVVRVSAPSQVLVADGFTGGGTLNGRTTDVGAVTWSARAGAYLGSGRVMDSAAVGGVPIDVESLGSYPLLGVSADADPTGSEWVGVGLASQATASYWSAGQAWVLVRPGGGFSVFVGGSKVASGTIPGTPVGSFHRMEIRYGTTTGQVEALLNGQIVYSGTVGSALDVQFAGFHMYGAAEGGGKLDNFEVVSTAAP